MYCTRCGHPNKDDARFCANCGAPLHEDTTMGIAPVEVEEEGGEEFPFPGEQLEAGQALLLVKRGQNAGSTFLIDADTTSIGRNPSSDVFLDDVTVSRRHAELRRAGSEGSTRFELRDVGSLNGTYVNRERVEEITLHSGDEVQIGKFKLAFFQSGE
jgi:pSer/pThr/pTyr-binding forkhead associated (FHA) protein